MQVIRKTYRYQIRLSIKGVLEALTYTTIGDQNQEGVLCLIQSTTLIVGEMQENLLPTLRRKITLQHKILLLRYKKCILLYEYFQLYQIILIHNSLSFINIIFFSDLDYDRVKFLSRTVS